MIEEKQSTAEQITSAATSWLLACGLDIVHSFDAARYNEHIAQHASLRPLPLFDRQRALGLLIGNTRNFWPRFVEALRTRSELQNVSHPLDTYVVGEVQSCADQIPYQTMLRFAHVRDERLVSMLHLAEVSGLAHIGPAHLAVHLGHGPWFGLRAVIVVDAEPPSVPPENAPNPCSACDAPCRRASDRAFGCEATGGVASSWKAWVAVRDVCLIGRSSRYGEERIHYHYTKNRVALYTAAGITRIDP